MVQNRRLVSKQQTDKKNKENALENLNKMGHENNFIIMHALSNHLLQSIAEPCNSVV